MSLLRCYSLPEPFSDDEACEISRRILATGKGARFHVHGMQCWWDVGHKFHAATGPVLRRITWDQARLIADGGDAIKISEGCQ